MSRWNFTFNRVESPGVGVVTLYDALQAEHALFIHKWVGHSLAALQRTSLAQGQCCVLGVFTESVLFIELSVSNTFYTFFPLQNQFP
jgi:hypothetical protein